MDLFIYITMTTLGMLTKLWAFSVTRKHWRNSPIYYLTMGLVCVLLAQSLIEFYSYLPALKEHPPGQYRAVLGYYICVMLFVSILPFIGLQLTRKKSLTIWTKIFLAYNSTVLFLLIFTDLIMSGALKLEVSYTAVRGDFYFLFVISAFVSIGFIVYSLSKKADGTSNFVSIRANNILLTSIPFILFSAFILLSKLAGINVNAIGILPICFSLFIVAIVNSICHEQITDYSYWIPFSKKKT